MAWNKPGGSSGSNKRGGNGGLGDLLNRLPGFGGGMGEGGVLRWVLIGLGLWLVFNCFVLVTEQQRGVVLRFGLYDRVMQPGPHFKLPWPLERVIKVNATQIKTFSDTVPILTRDENIVSVEINVQYRISDAQLYLFGTRNADEVLQEATLSAVREQVGKSDLDTVLSARAALSVSSKQRLQEAMERYRPAWSITELNLPERAAAGRGEAGLRRRQQRPAGQGSRQERSRGLRQQDRARGAGPGRARAHRRRGLQDRRRSPAPPATPSASPCCVEQYKAAPEVTRKRLWLETLQQVMAGNRKVVGWRQPPADLRADGRREGRHAGAGASGHRAGPGLADRQCHRRCRAHAADQGRPDGREEPSR